MLNIVMLANSAEYGSAEYLGGLLFDIFKTGILFFIVFLILRKFKNKRNKIK